MAKAVLKLVNEEYDLVVSLKEAISTYVTLGYVDVDLKLENGVYRWSGIGDYRVYDEYFEEPLKQIAKQEYIEKSKSLISTSSCPEYLLNV